MRRIDVVPPRKTMRDILVDANVVDLDRVQLRIAFH